MGAGCGRVVAVAWRGRIVFGMVLGRAVIALMAVSRGAPVTVVAISRRTLVAVSVTIAGAVPMAIPGAIAMAIVARSIPARIRLSSA